MSRLLVAAGCRALHEANGRDGSVSCWLAFPDWWHPHAQANGTRADFPDAVLLHIVRHPLAAIASLATFEHKLFWSWQRWHTGLDYAPGVEFAARFWVTWNERIDAQSPFARISIEHPERAWPRIADGLGLGEMPRVEIDPTWQSKTQPLAWDDLGDLKHAVRAMAEKMGYDT